MKLFFVLLALALTALLAFELMVVAFRLMNQPSDTSVFEGMGLLALTVALLFLGIRTLWRRVL